MTVDELTAVLVEHERTQPSHSSSANESDRVALSLHHVHLPKLAAHDLIEYDRTDGYLEPTATFDRHESKITAVIDATESTFDTPRDCQ
nr:hypothetical protein [Natronorubrum daqingense]